MRLLHMRFINAEPMGIKPVSVRCLPRSDDRVRYSRTSLILIVPTAEQPQRLRSWVIPPLPSPARPGFRSPTRPHLRPQRDLDARSAPLRAPTGTLRADTPLHRAGPRYNPRLAERHGPERELPVYRRLY